MSRHYLDHASTSPPRPEALAAMAAWWDEGPGDPSRIHREGMTARVALENAREAIADFLGARPREVVLTSGASEAIAAAVSGAARRNGARTTQVVTAVEHSAVSASVDRAGPVRTVPVDASGRVDPGAVIDALADDTACVHVQWANHEVGTIQPVAEIISACRARDVLVHVDAAMAVGHVPLSFVDLGADLMSVSAHKMGGPPGIGALLVRRGLRLDPLVLGADQERARRAGFENGPAVAGWAAVAATLSLPGRLDAEATEARRLTDRVLAGVAAMDGVSVYGDPVRRVPHLVCVGTEGVEPQAVVLGLDRAGVAVHSGSACASEAIEPSPVLAAMGVDADRSLRASVGWTTTDADIEAALEALPAVLADLRALTPRS